MPYNSGRGHLTVDAKSSELVWTCEMHNVYQKDIIHGEGDKLEL